MDDKPWKPGWYLATEVKKGDTILVSTSPELVLVTDNPKRPGGRVNLTVEIDGETEEAEYYEDTMVWIERR